jgi:hypothetical protein
MSIYCGTSRDLPRGYNKKGSRKGCLSKGVGIGIMLERKAKQEGKTKIFNKSPGGEKTYCGNKNRLPDEYDRFGNLAECLRKGVGTGIFLEHDREDMKKCKENIEKNRKWDREERGEIKEMKEGKGSDKKEKKESKKGSKKRSKKKSSKKMSPYMKFRKENYKKVKKRLKTKNSSRVIRELKKMWAKRSR